MTSIIFCKAERLIAMRDLLRSGRPMTTKELADQLGVGQRSVQRYLCDLESTPLCEPIVCDDNKYWSLVRQKVWFTNTALAWMSLDHGYDLRKQT